MSLTIGNVQKFGSLAVKHYWCHGIITTTPDSAPIDRFVIEAAKVQLRNAGLRVVAPSGAWSSFDIDNYRLAYQLVTQAAALCRLTAAEWELYVFQPGNGATPLVPGVTLPPLALAKARFLTANNRAANPGDSKQTVDMHAKKDARSAAFLMGARPYDMPKAQIARTYPGAFEAFKNECEAEALRLASEVASKPSRNRAWYENEFSTILRNARRTYPFV